MISGKFKKLFIYIGIAILTLIANVAIKIVPFKKLMTTVTNTDSVVVLELTSAQIKRLRYGIAGLDAIRRRVPWRVMCFEQALVCLVFARILKLNMNVYFGINKSDGRLTAHSWTEAGGMLVSGGSNAHLFTTVYQRGFVSN